MKQLAVYNGPFGRVRVVERRRDGARSYLTGSSLQTLVDASGASLFGYVNALKILLKDRQKILMVGGAGGSLATMLARKGHNVTVMDIDPMAERVARRFFHLDSRIEWVTADGLTFQGNSRDAYDAIVIDACTSHGTVEGFTRAEWIEQAMSRITADGVLMLNLAYDLLSCGKIVIDGFTLAEKLSAFGFYSVLLRPDEGWEGNEILMVSRSERPIKMRRAEIMARPTEAHSYLLSLRSYRTKAGSPT